MLSKKLTHTLPILILLGIITVIFGLLEWLSPLYFLTHDNFYDFLPAALLNWRSLTEAGQVPLINWYQSLGVDYLGQSQYAVFYPPAYLATFLAYLLNRPHWSLEFVALFHLLLAGAGMYWLALKLKSNSYLSVLAGLGWVSWPYVTSVSRSWLVVGGLAAWLPWCFAATETWWAGRLKGLGWLVLFGVVLGYSGHVQSLVLVSVGVLLVFGFRSGLGVLRGTFNWKYLATFWAGLLAAAVATGFSLLPLLLPLYQAKLNSSNRSGVLPLEEFVNKSLVWSEFFRAQLLDFANPSLSHYHSTHIFFLGLPLVVVPVLWWKLRRSKQILIPASYFAAAMAALLMSTSWYRVFYVVPVLNWFRFPFKNFILVGFGIWVSLVVLVANLKPKQWPFAYVLLILSVVIQLTILLVTTNRDNAFSTFPYQTPPQLLSPSEIDYTNFRVVAFGLADRPATDEVAALTFNLASLFPVHSLGGIAPLPAATNQELNFNLTLRSSLEASMSADLITKLQERSVGYLITDSLGAKELEKWPELELVVRQRGMWVYHVPGTLPIVAKVNQGLVEPAKHRFVGNRLELDVTEAEWVSLSLAPHQNFRLEIDGASAPLPTDFPMTIPIPEGSRRLILTYTNPWLWRGLFLAGGFWVGVGIVWWGKRRVWSW